MSGALIVRQQGGPETMVWEDRQVGDPGPHDIKLRHTAIGVNFIDIYQRGGMYPMQTPFVPGNEGVGEVIAVGEAVTDFQVGDRVGYSSVLGAYAEERLVPAGRAFSIPDGIDDQTAAASMLKGLTVYYLIFLTWPLQHGETVLWHAAAGGVGSIGVQWSKALGARVFGTAGTPEKVALAKSLGCDEVINYREEDFAKRVRELTEGRGVDVVYDGVGKDTFEGSLDSLRPRGLLASFGSASGAVSIPNLGLLASKGSLFVTRPTGSHYYPDTDSVRTAASALFDVIGDGTVKVAVDHSFALRDAAEAHRALEGRQTTGSIVLVP